MKSANPHNASTELETFSIKSRRYLGAKTKLLPFIQEVVSTEIGPWKVFVDIFSGTGVVADQFNQEGKSVIVNDLLHSNYLSYLTFFSPQEVDEDKVRRMLVMLNDLPGSDNYFSEHFGGSFFTLENAQRIGAIRDEIEAMAGLNERERSMLITSLFYAADKAANTFGHFEAFRKGLDTLTPLLLRMPKVASPAVNRGNKIYRMDANALALEIESDVVYIDPPYNSRQYVDAYHVLENLAQWQRPGVTGIAKKMEGRDYGKSEYCKKAAPEAFDELISRLRTKWIIVSYSNMAQKGDGRSNAKISDEDIISSLEKRGGVKSFSQAFQQFSAGISDIQGLEERLFLCEVR